MDNHLIYSKILPHPIFYVRVASVNSPLHTLITEEPLQVESKMHIFRYELRDRKGVDEYDYHFAGIETTDMSIPEDSFDVGFAEPDENVNLDKLKKKLRDNKEIKSLLLKYYRRK